jgi:hypothetical protein
MKAVLEKPADMMAAPRVGALHPRARPSAQAVPRAAAWARVLGTSMRRSDGSSARRRSTSRVSAGSVTSSTTAVSTPAAVSASAPRRR